MCLSKRPAFASIFDSYGLFLRLFPDDSSIERDMSQGVHHIIQKWSCHSPFADYERVHIISNTHRGDYYKPNMWTDRYDIVPSCIDIPRMRKKFFINDSYGCFGEVYCICLLKLTCSGAFRDPDRASNLLWLSMKDTLNKRATLLHPKLHLFTSPAYFQNKCVKYYGNTGNNLPDNVYQTAPKCFKSIYRRLCVEEYQRQRNIRTLLDKWNATTTRLYRDLDWTWPTSNKYWTCLFNRWLAAKLSFQLGPLIYHKISQRL